MTITTWYLEMTGPEQLRPARAVEGFEAERRGFRRYDERIGR